MNQFRSLLKLVLVLKWITFRVLIFMDSKYVSFGRREVVETGSCDGRAFKKSDLCLCQSVFLLVLFFLHTPTGQSHTLSPKLDSSSRIVHYSCSSSSSKSSSSWSRRKAWWESKKASGRNTGTVNGIRVKIRLLAKLTIYF